jgi:predicted phosphoadenosine phosphosulfate sulfurtransferase
MRILEQRTVLEAALERINFIFDEFKNVAVGISGGKDSTVVFHLALKVARERNRLPLRVYFIDQEAEWTWTIDQVRESMYHPDVHPMWYQFPFHLDNATSYETKFLKCWDPAEEAKWCHPKDPISIKENLFGTDRFKELFQAMLRHEFPGEKAATIAGVRTEESPSRFVGLTTFATYKWVTWGSKMGPNKYTFYPIYDWSFRDVWHAIHTNKWSYNKLYDYYYRYGVPLQQMRVSNLHHETAVRALFILQEFDHDLYDRLSQRLPGVGTAGHMGWNFYSGQLPFMFANWREYRDHLIDKLCANDPEWQADLRKRTRKWDELLVEQPVDLEAAAGVVVDSILCNDYTGTKLENYQLHFIAKYRYDRVDLFLWPESNTLERGQDSVVYDFLYKKVTTRQWSYEENGRRYHRRHRWRYWLVDNVIHREKI